MLKKILVSAAAVAASFIPLSGVASADDGSRVADLDGIDSLVNIHDLDLLNNLNLNLGICGNTVDVLGLTVLLENIANGISIPELPPVDEKIVGTPLENCASTSGGSQGN